ncbi:MAG: hypothetical protein KKA65_04730 [Nanoarchaeota archaeon]|nr:hypothetical protein [Nanoarchaeota archaeon]MBU4351982.1 hypothetical protein [Nanoarchaeota archaeon]MBU4456781.1 hypothetical protein [Nanoarchaeota archaeon]MCG2720248.1 hypothetical protein [Nanoarchaeota archaeon]
MDKKQSLDDLIAQGKITRDTPLPEFIQYRVQCGELTEDQANEDLIDLGYEPLKNAKRHWKKKWKKEQKLRNNLFLGITTKEYLQGLKEEVVQTYKNSQYITPVAMLQAVGTGIFSDVMMTGLRAFERVHNTWWNVSMAFYNRKYHMERMMKVFEKR